MIILKHRVCKHEGFSKYPSFGVAGNKSADICAHAAKGMVDVVHRICKHEG